VAGAPARDVAVWLDGVRVAPSEARVSVFDRGFLYGDSVFETIRTYGGRPFALREHVERLAWSAGRVFIDVPVTLDALCEEVERATHEAAYEESYLRLMLTRGVGAMGLDPGLSEHPLRVLIVAPLVSPPPEAYRDGVSVITFATQRVGDATGAAGAKVGNYLVVVLAMRQARQAGAVEALIVDHDGRVVEGSTSNVFVVRDQCLYTPSEADGILPGITRARVLTVARELGLPVVLGPLERERIEHADEVFISSSIRELLPVVRIDGRIVGAGTPGPVTRALHAAFRASVQGRSE
jgi:branched-chain amino acid aminotransferase